MSSDAVQKRSNTVERQLLLEFPVDDGGIHLEFLEHAECAPGLGDPLEEDDGLRVALASSRVVVPDAVVHVLRRRIEEDYLGVALPLVLRGGIEERLILFGIGEVGHAVERAAIQEDRLFTLTTRLHLRERFEFPLHRVERTLESKVVARVGVARRGHAELRDQDRCDFGHAVHAITERFDARLHERRLARAGSAREHDHRDVGHEVVEDRSRVRHALEVVGEDGEVEVGDGVRYVRGVGDPRGKCHDLVRIVDLFLGEHDAFERAVELVDLPAVVGHVSGFRDVEREEFEEPSRETDIGDRALFFGPRAARARLHGEEGFRLAAVRADANAGALVRRVLGEVSLPDLHPFTPPVDGGVGLANQEPFLDLEGRFAVAIGVDRIGAAGHRQFSLLLVEKAWPETR